jgi:phosphate starvation-inducible membrane PsiE
MMILTFLCKKKTPFFNGVLFRRGGRETTLERVASLEEIVSFFVYFKASSVSYFTRAVNELNYGSAPSVPQPA